MFEKFGFTEEIKDNQWIKEDLVIYAGLGQSKDGYFSIELYTLCGKEDIGHSDKIIFRGELNEIERYFRSHNRPETIDELLEDE